jgi:hypothetical protein
VIGYGQADTPVAGEPNQLQTFAYVPVVGTDVLSTGEYLGWYTPGAGSIAFDLTGGTGILNNPNIGSLQLNVFPASAIPNRSYDVGFTATAAEAPEPSYTVALGIGLGLMMLFRRRFKLGFTAQSQ